MNIKNLGPPALRGLPRVVLYFDFFAALRGFGDLRFFCSRGFLAWLFCHFFSFACFRSSCSFAWFSKLFDETVRAYRVRYGQRKTSSKYMIYKYLMSIDCRSITDLIYTIVIYSNQIFYVNFDGGDSAAGRNYISYYLFYNVIGSGLTRSGLSFSQVSGISYSHFRNSRYSNYRCNIKSVQVTAYNLYRQGQVMYYLILRIFFSALNKVLLLPFLDFFTIRIILKSP